MLPAKPVRVFDISKKLNLATSTVIEFLAKRGYPVERLHHTPLITDILKEVLTANGVQSDSLVAEKFNKDAEIWEQEHRDIADTIRQKYLHGKDRIQQRQERSRRVIEGRERARIQREQKELKREKISQKMKTAVEVEFVKTDGRIPVSPLDLEIIHRALALEIGKKKAFLNQLRLLSDQVIIH